MPQESLGFRPLKAKVHLAPTPQRDPQYKITIKNKDGQELNAADPKATRALVALMNQHAVIGGAAAHWGGPAAFAEIMSATHALMFRDKSRPWYEQFNFVNDAGHTENGIYALRANYGFDNLSFEDLKKFRSIESKLTGHGEAHLNPEGVYISNGPLGSGIPQAQGLALADKLLKNDRMTICTLSDGGSMEGEAKESFAAIPGLAKKERLNPFVLIISDNNTKLSGRIDEDSFDMEPTFQSLEALGWHLIKEKQGNDLQTVFLTIEKAIEQAKKDPTKPIAIVFKTVKGFGVKQTEQSKSGGHGYPLGAYDEKLVAFINEIYQNQAPEEFVSWAKHILENKPNSEKKSSSIKTDKVQPGFAQAAIQAAKEGLPVCSLSSDLQGSTGIDPFHKEFPHLSFDLGVAEANMISTAIGMAKQGFIPIVDTFAQFGITKGNLPLIMSQLSEGAVIGLFSHIGFQDAADGASHQATTYLAAVSSIPNTVAICCSCLEEAKALMYKAIKRYEDQRLNDTPAESVIFFYGREKFPVTFDEKQDYPWGKAQIIKKGSDVVIVSTGPMLSKALQAREELAVFGIKATVIHNPFVNRPDINTIGRALNESGKRLITIEDHQLVGGMGAQLVHSLKLAGYEFEVASLGNHGKFGQSAYKADHLYDLHELNSTGIKEAFNRFS